MENFVLGLVLVASGLVVVAFVYLISQIRKALMSSREQVPLDLRRADDGRDTSGGAAGPGLGPMFPPS